MNTRFNAKWNSVAVLALVCAIVSLLSTVAYGAYPDMQNVAKPNPEPTLPTGADTFSPPVDTSTPAANTPAIAEWIRTAAPDDSLVLTGVRFSSYTGNDQGKDSYFAVYGQVNGTGVTANSQIQKLNDVKAAVTLYSGLPTWSMYLLWPGNSAGAGYPVAVNRTEVWWVGPYKASVGDTVSVFGRNLSHDNGTSSSWVYIKPAGSAGQYATVTAVNPYKVDFTVPSGLSNGSYEIWVHNGHGGHYGWGGPVTLTVQSAETWPGSTYNVTTYGAVPNDANDDTTAISNALADARNSGTNGTVYFPSGTYYISQALDVGGGYYGVATRLLGAGKTSTIIKCLSGSSPSMMLHPAGHGCEFKDLTIDTNGVSMGYAICTRDHMDDFRLTNVKIDAHLTLALDTHGCSGHIYTNSDFVCSGLSLIVVNQFYIKNCNFYGRNDCNVMLYQWGGNGFCLTGCTMRDFDNSNPNSGDGWAIGRFHTFGPMWETCQNIYAGDNTTYDLGVRPGVDNNQGEQFMSEGATKDYLGSPTSATSTTVTFSDLNLGSAYVLNREAIITKGPGIGQHRTITAYNSGTKTITVSPAWNVNPDSTSKVAITTTTMRVAIYHNTLDGKNNYATFDSGSVGVELFEGGQDAVIDSNTFTNFHRGATSNWSYNTTERFNPLCFTVVSNNTASNCYWAGRECAGWSWTPDNGSVYFANIFRNNSYTNMTNDGVQILNNNNGNAPKAWDFALFEHNAFTTTPRGFYFGQNAGSATQSSIFYKNNVNGGAGTGVTGIEISTGQQINLRQNTWSNFTTTYGGTLPGAVLEVPYRAISLTSSGTNQTADISVWNAGTSSLSWTASDDATWLTLSSTSGTAANESSSSTITLTANPSGLAAGTYTGTITITGASQTKKVTVTFTVTWVPTSISGLTIWLEADAGVTKDGSNYVATWADQSGNSRNATQSTQAYKPLWVNSVQNGKPVIRFDGSDDYLTVSGASLSNQSIFVVYKAVSNQIGGSVLSGSNWYIQEGGGSVYQWNNLYTSGFYFETSAFRYISNIYNSGVGTVYENGTQKVSGGDSTSAVLANIGRRADGVKFAGDVAEVLIYNSALSTANRQAVETYLKNKYGL